MTRMNMSEHHVISMNKTVDLCMNSVAGEHSNILN